MIFIVDDGNPVINPLVWIENNSEAENVDYVENYNATYCVRIMSHAVLPNNNSSKSSQRFEGYQSIMIPKLGSPVVSLKQGRTQN